MQVMVLLIVSKALAIVFMSKRGLRLGINNAVSALVDR